MRSGYVYYRDEFAGIITETSDGFKFTYNQAYLKLKSAKPVSLTMPLRELPYESDTIHPFFDGLIPEGWLLDLAQKNWKFDRRDRMGLLLLLCNDTIGAVSVKPAITGAFND
ncbi:MAG: HipA N-terminal domain-containing protein [Ignavibacteriaceae bacterium]|nr:HipA N-terminal domain-containing protein [Ignavibacteriaceae bacterium]